MAEPSRYTVLVVDDEPPILDLVQRTLAGKFEVRRAESGSEALEILRSQPVDIIVADQRMPGMSGAELLALAKAERPEAGRLLLTGSTDVEALAAAVNLGEVQAYLAKPWERAALVEAVEKIAEKTRLSRENRRLAQALEAANAELTRRAAQLEAAVHSLEGEVAARRQAERELNEHRQNLEELVVRRTRALKDANEQLKQEIAERKQAEAALRQSENNFRNLFENLAIGIFEATPGGRVLRVNQTYARLFGYASPQEVADMATDVAKQIYVYPERRADIIRRAASTAAVTVENEYQRKDGSVFVGWLTLQAFRDQTGQVVHFLGYVQDITELKRAQDEIQTLNRELERRIRERTAELESEIAEHHQAEEKRAQLLNQLEQQVTSRAQELAALYRVTEAATIGGSLVAQLEHLLETARLIGDSPAGVFHLLQREGDGSVRWQLTVEQGFTLPETVWLEAWAAAGPWKLVHRRQGITLVGDLAEEFPAAPPELSMVRGAYLGLPIRVKDNWLGVLSLFRPAGQKFTAHETSLSAALIDQLGLAVESMLLRQRSEEAAVMEERQRLARELHDSVTQLVYSLVLFAGAGREAAKIADLTQLAYQLSRIDATAQQALKEMRLLLYELRPAALQSAGLAKALQQRLDMVERRANVVAELDDSGEAEIPPSLQAPLYQIAQEALNNALKHARAKRVAIRIGAAADAISLEVADNGAGFDLAEAAEGGGLGLDIMRERAAALGGALHIITAPGQGTRITVTLPRPPAT